MMEDMTSVFVIGDPHIRRNTIPESREMVQRVVAEAKKRNPSFIVILGDTLDRFGDMRIEAHCLAIREFISPLVDIAHVYLLIGNHDMVNNSQFLTNQHPFAGLERWKGVTVVDRVISEMINGKRFTFCPYTPDGRFVEALNTIGNVWMESAVIFCHQTFRGARRGLQVSVKGDVWDITFPCCVSGHEHDHDWLQSNILYTGTPMQLSFGDKGLKTAAVIRVRERSKEEEVGKEEGERKMWDIEEERVDLNLPKRVHIKIMASEVPYFTPPTIGMIKITITGTTSENYVVKQMLCIKQWEDRGIMVVYDYLKGITTTTPNYDTKVEQTPRYRDALYTAVSQNPAMLDIYTRLYSNNISS